MSDTQHILYFPDASVKLLDELFDALSDCDVLVIRLSKVVQTLPRTFHIRLEHLETIRVVILEYLWSRL